MTSSCLPTLQVLLHLEHHPTVVETLGPDHLAVDADHDATGRGRTVGRGLHGFTFATVVESALPVGVAAMTAAVLLLAAGILALPTALVVLPWPRGLV